MSTEIATPPAAAPAAIAPAAAAPAPAKAANPSPKSTIPPAAVAEQARKESIAKVWGPDPAKAAAEPAKAEPAAAKKPDLPPALDIIEQPAAAAEPAKMAVVEHPEDKLAEPTSESAKAGWKELKTIAKEQRSRVTALEQELASLKKAPATAANASDAESLRAELATTKEQAKAAMDRLLILDVQNHPDFHKQFVLPKKAALETAKEVIGYNGKEVADLGTLLGKPLKDFNAEVSAITEKMNAADASTVMQSLRQARDLHAQEQGALAKAGEVHTQLQQRTQQAQRQAFDSVVGDALPKFKKMEIAETMSADERAMAEKFNQSIDGLRARAEAAAFGKIDEKGTANLALKAVALEHMVEHAIPAMQRGMKARDTLIAEMRTELEALRGGRGPAARGDSVEAAPANESIEVAAKRLFNRT